MIEKYHLLKEKKFLFRVTIEDNYNLIFYYLIILYKYSIYLSTYYL